LVGADGSQIGIKPLPEALAIARDADLDLVEVAAQANPPVCRIMDYGKWKYEAAQQAKESRRKATNVSIKEMKYRPKIGVGDFDTKTRKVEKFLAEGHKVKVTIMFRGRETQHPELGRRILDRVADRVVHLGKVEVIPKLDGRNMIMVLAPDKKAKAAWEALKRAEAEAAGEVFIPIEDRHGTAHISDDSGEDDSKLDETDDLTEETDDLTEETEETEESATEVDQADDVA
jgi:translation initiation factor IF-3